MGYSLTPYAVDLNKIAAAIGSGNASLVDALSQKNEDEFENIDALGDDFCDDEDDDNKTSGERNDAKRRGPPSMDEALTMLKEIFLKEESPEEEKVARISKKKRDEEDRPPCATTVEALRHLIMGEERDRRIGFKYGYVLEVLCRHFGEGLPNDLWCDLRSCHGWFEELDDTLRLAGVPAESLSIREHLVGRGSPVPLPKIRDFPAIGYLRGEEVRRALDALGKAKIDDIGEEEEEEPWLPEGLDDVRGWLRKCVETGRDLVCFYY